MRVRDRHPHALPVPASRFQVTSHRRFLLRWCFLFYGDVVLSSSDRPKETEENKIQCWPDEGSPRKPASLVEMEAESLLFKQQNLLVSCSRRLPKQNKKSKNNPMLTRRPLRTRSACPTPNSKWNSERWMTWTTTARSTRWPSSRRRRAAPPPALPPPVVVVARTRRPPIRRRRPQPTNQVTVEEEDRRLRAVERDRFRCRQTRSRRRRRRRGRPAASTTPNWSRTSCRASSACTAAAAGGSTSCATASAPNSTTR